MIWTVAQASRATVQLGILALRYFVYFVVTSQLHRRPEESASGYRDLIDAIADLSCRQRTIVAVDCLTAEDRNLAICRDHHTELYRLIMHGDACDLERNAPARSVIDVRDALHHDARTFTLIITLLNRDERRAVIKRKVTGEFQKRLR